MEQIRIKNLESELGDGDMIRIIWSFIATRLSPLWIGLMIRRTINIPDKDHAEELVLQQAKPTSYEAICMRSIMLLKNFLPNLTLDMQRCSRSI